MNIEQVRDYTLSLYGVTEDQPFGDDIITFRRKKPQIDKALVGQAFVHF